MHRLPLTSLARAVAAGWRGVGLLPPCSTVHHALCPTLSGEAVGDCRRWMTASPTKKAARARASREQPLAAPLRRLTVALVGCPNVGKSTLFNRLTHTRQAIVNKASGTTRDWKEGEGRIGNLSFNVVDTGGLDESGAFGADMLPHTHAVVKHADVVLFLIDARLGVTPEDKHFAQWVRRNRDGPVFVVANKTDGLLDKGDGQEVWDQLSADMFKLGLGDQIPASAEHGEGLVDIHDVLMPIASAGRLPAALKTVPATVQSDEEAHGHLSSGGDAFPQEDDAAPHVETVLSLAIAGRPNVGKSTLLNELIGESRVLTSPVAGTTRDAVRVLWDYKGLPIELVDTAGIERLGKWDPGALIDSVAVSAATRTLSKSSVVVLVVDASNPMTRQDLALAQAIMDAGRGLVVGLNKMDTSQQADVIVAAVKDRVERAVWEASGVPCVPMAAKFGRGVHELMPAVLQVFDNWSMHIPARKLNAWYALMARHHPPPALTRTVFRRLQGTMKSVPTQSTLKIKFITQVSTQPPTFAVFANRSEVPESYQRFLVNALREEFGFKGVPLRLHVRAPKNPYGRQRE